MREKPAEYSATQGMRQLPGTFCMDLNAQEGRKMNFTPQLSEVRAIAAEKKYAVVPISCEILSDICTPILTDLVDAVLVGDELALDVLTLQRAAQQGGIRQIELTGCRIAAGTPVSVNLLRSLLIHTQLFFTFPYYYANGFSVGYGRLLGWL